MEKKDFKNLLSETFDRYDKKSKKFLRASFEKYDKGLKKFLKKTFEENNKEIEKEVREEFSRFVDVSIIPQFEGIHEELNDMSHRQDQMLRILEKHEDHLEGIEANLQKALGRRQEQN